MGEPELGEVVKEEALPSSAMAQHRALQLAEDHKPRGICSKQSGEPGVCQRLCTSGSGMEEPSRMSPVGLGWELKPWNLLHGGRAGRG